MTLTIIEKAAKLMGYEVSTPEPDTIAMSMPHTKGSAWVTKGKGGWIWFNPYTNKSDLIDLECELGIDVDWDDSASSPNIRCQKKFGNEFFYEKVWLECHPDKFTARAHAVMSVVEQIYDAKFGKDGE